MTKIITFLTFFTLLASPLTNAAVFKCEAADGSVTYSDRPCKDGVVEELNLGSSKKPNSQSGQAQTPATARSGAGDCGQSVKNGKDWIESMIDVGRTNLETGDMSRADHDKGLRELNQLKSFLTVQNCERATGDNKRFFDCLSKITNHLALCGQRHQPDL